MSFSNISLINLNSQFNPFYSSITIDSSGNVGVGKTVPTTNLDVSGNIKLSGVITGSGANLISLNATNITSGVLSVRCGGTGASTLTSGSILVGNELSTILQPTNLVWNNNNSILDVNGTIKSTSLLCSGGAVIIDASNNVNIDSGILYIDASKNNVGIGTITPDSTTKLHVLGNARIQGDLKVNGTFEQVNTVQNTTEQLKITNDGTGPAVIINQTGAQDILDIQDDSNTCFKILDGGNVAIGTSNKAVNVDISGNLKLSGTITGSGSSLSNIPYFNLTNKLTVGNGLEISPGSAATSPNLTLNLSAGTGIIINTTVNPATIGVSGLTTTLIPDLATSKITGLDAALTAKQATIISTAGQVIIGNGDGATTTSTGLTWTTGTNLLSATNLTISGATIHTGTSIFTGNVGVGTTVVATNVLQVGGGGRLRISNGATDYTLIGSIDADGVNNTKILLSAIDRGGTILGGNIEYYASAVGQHIFYTTSSTTERMRIGNNGNVSIGTTDTATYKLNVNGTVFVTGLNLPITINSGIIWDGNAALGRAVAGGSYSDSAVAGDIILRSAAANKLILQSGYGSGAIVIATTNNVGIGKTDPGTKLDVVGTVTATLFSGSGASLSGLPAANITGTLAADKGGTGCTSLNTTIFDTSGGILSLKSGSAISSQWTTLNNNIYFNTGNIGIGIINPNYKLHVEDGILFVGDSLYLNNSSLNIANNYYLLFDNTYNATMGLGIAANKIRLMNDTSNNILAGFGMENNSIAYHSGTSGSHTFYSGTTSSNYGTGRFQIDRLGNITCTGDFAAFTSISDKRLKTNIIKLDSSIDIIKNLNPVKFNWKYNDFIIDNKQGKEDVGFIAQEIEQIIPLATGEYKVINSEETYKNIKYERIIPYLVKSIQELIDKVDKLEQEIKQNSEILNIKLKMEKMDKSINKLY